jgi:hypothetical protein
MYKGGSLFIVLDMPCCSVFTTDGFTGSGDGRIGLSISAVDVDCRHASRRGGAWRLQCDDEAVTYV